MFNDEYISVDFVGIQVKFHGKSGWIVLDQIRTVDKKRLVKKLGKIENTAIRKVKDVIKEMLVD
jgi:mRNA interferase MazF